MQNVHNDMTIPENRQKKRMHSNNVTIWARFEPHGFLVSRMNAGSTTKH